MPIPQDLIAVLETLVALIGAYVVVFWAGLVLWTVRDIRSRTRDIFSWILAGLLVLIFFLPGLLIYYLLRPRETLAEAYERELEEEALLHSLEEQSACPSCKQRADPDYLICPNCHTQLKQTCPQCGRILRLTWTVCPYCAHPVLPREHAVNRVVT